MRAAPPTRPHLLLLLLLPGRGRQQRRFLQLGSFLPLLLLLLAAWCPAVRKRKRLLLDRVAAVRPSAETALASMILMCLSRACLVKGAFFKQTGFWFFRTSSCTGSSDGGAATNPSSSCCCAVLLPPSNGVAISSAAGGGACENKTAERSAPPRSAPPPPPPDASTSSSSWARRRRGVSVGLWPSSCWDAGGSCERVKAGVDTLLAAAAALP
jgi:hypothetical protein